MRDYIIIGQGLAGSVMAHTLREAGKNFYVIDSPEENTSSTVAAGIMNPITGKRLTLTWRAHDFFPRAKTFYQNTDTFLQEKTLYPMPVYRIFSSVGESNDWASRVFEEHYQGFLGQDAMGDLSSTYHNPGGAMRVEMGGRLDVKAFMTATKQWLIEAKVFAEKRVNPQDLVPVSGGYKLGDIQAQRVIFCTGLDKEFWGFLPFTPMKGELLELSSDDLDQDKVVVGGCFLSPKSGNRFYAGATYNWRTIDTQITDEGRNEVVEKLNKFIQAPYEIVGQYAGIRPAVKDRRPLLGQHPELEGVYLFSGLGSKGVSMAPLLSEELLEHMEYGKELDSSMDLKRFL